MGRRVLFSWEIKPFGFRGVGQFAGRFRCGLVLLNNKFADCLQLGCDLLLIVRH